MANYNTILLEVGGGVATLTVNRPEVRNALGKETVEEMHAALRELAARDDVRVLILTGAGDKAFVSGADIREIRQRGKREALDAINQELFTAVENFLWPVIAAVNGYALGGGFELALACDLRVAAEEAKFGFPETGLGIMPAAGGTQRLPRIVGRGPALSLLLLAETIEADEAFRIGLVNRVVPELQPALQELIAILCSRGPIALRYAKEAIAKGLDMTLDQGLRLEGDLNFLLQTTVDRAEGVRAFLEKRAAQFHGS